MEWHDLRDVIEDNKEVRAAYKQYRRERWYKSAAEQPEHPYAKFATSQCDNLILDQDMYCQICGNKHAKYTLKNGWQPIGKPRRDQGCGTGYNSVSKPANRFPRGKDEPGSDHSSDGTDCSEELYSDDGWQLVGEQVQAQQELAEAVEQFTKQKRAAEPQRLSTREELKRKYPEIYAD